MNVSNSDQVFLKMIHIILYFNVRLFEKGFETSKWLLRQLQNGYYVTGTSELGGQGGHMPTHFFA